MTSYRDEMNWKAYDAISTIVASCSLNTGTSAAELISELLMQGVNPNLIDSAVEAVKERHKC